MMGSRHVFLLSVALLFSAFLFFARSEDSHVSGIKLSHSGLRLPSTSTEVSVRVEAKGGCVSWTLHNAAFVTLHPDESSTYTESGRTCTPAVWLTTRPEFFLHSDEKSAQTRVVAYDAQIGRSASVDVYVAAIKRVEVLTTVRHLLVGDRELLEVLAFDSEDNVFSSLDGVSFKWSVQQRGPKNSENLLSFLSPDNVLSRSVRDRHAHQFGLNSYRIVAECLLPGRVIITVCMEEDASVCISKDISVVDKLEIHPSYPVRGYDVQYSLQKQVAKENTFKNIVFPSDSFMWELDDACLSHGHKIDSMGRFTGNRDRCLQDPPKHDVCTVTARSRIFAENYQTAVITVSFPTTMEVAFTPEAKYDDENFVHSFVIGRSYVAGIVLKDEMGLRVRAAAEAKWVMDPQCECENGHRVGYDTIWKMGGIIPSLNDPFIQSNIEMRAENVSKKCDLVATVPSLVYPMLTTTQLASVYPLEAMEESSIYPWMNMRLFLNTTAVQTIRVLFRGGSGRFRLICHDEKFVGKNFYTPVGLLDDEKSLGASGNLMTTLSHDIVCKGGLCLLIVDVKTMRLGDCVLELVDVVMDERLSLPVHTSRMGDIKISFADGRSKYGIDEEYAVITVPYDDEHGLFSVFSMPHMPYVLTCEEIDAFSHNFGEVYGVLSMIAHRPVKTEFHVDCDGVASNDLLVLIFGEVRVYPKELIMFTHSLANIFIYGGPPNSVAQLSTSAPFVNVTQSGTVLSGFHASGGFIGVRIVDDIVTLVERRVPVSVHEIDQIALWCASEDVFVDSPFAIKVVGISSSGHRDFLESSLYTFEWKVDGRVIDNEGFGSRMFKSAQARSIRVDISVRVHHGDEMRVLRTFKMINIHEPIHILGTNVMARPLFTTTREIEMSAFRDVFRNRMAEVQEVGEVDEVEHRIQILRSSEDGDKDMLLHVFHEVLPVSESFVRVKVSMPSYFSLNASVLSIRDTSSPINVEISFFQENGIPFAFVENDFVLNRWTPYDDDKLRVFVTHPEQWKALSLKLVDEGYVLQLERSSTSPPAFILGDRIHVHFILGDASWILPMTFSAPHVLEEQKEIQVPEHVVTQKLGVLVDRMVIRGMQTTHVVVTGGSEDVHCVLEDGSVNDVLRVWKNETVVKDGIRHHQFNIRLISTDTHFRTSLIFRDVGEKNDEIRVPVYFGGKNTIVNQSIPDEEIVAQSMGWIERNVRMQFWPTLFTVILAVILAGFITKVLF